MTDLSNSLADLAERVREANAASAAAQRHSIEKAFEAGLLLCRAKEECVHGEWLPFLDRAGIHERQARRLMQIASSGLQIGHVSEIGGVRAVLDYLTRVKLPKAGEITFICDGLEEDALGDRPCAWISHCDDQPGNFHITSVRTNDAVKTTRPYSGETIRCANGYFNAVLYGLSVMIDIPYADREFTVMPAELLEKLDDCPFLADIASVEELSEISITNAPVPLSYRRVLNAIDLCERQFSAANVIELLRLLKICGFRSNDWPDDPRMFLTFARIASEPFDERLANIEALAKLKWGTIDQEKLARHS